MHGHAARASLCPHEVEDPVFFRSTPKSSKVSEGNVAHERSREALIAQDAFEMLH